MGLRLIYGRAGSGKSEFCFKEIKEKIKHEENIYIITPEQFSFTAEKKLMQYLGTKSVINAEVITISRMADRLYESLGKNKATFPECVSSMDTEQDSGLLMGANAVGDGAPQFGQHSSRHIPRDGVQDFL